MIECIHTHFHYVWQSMTRLDINILAVWYFNFFTFYIFIYISLQVLEAPL